MTDFVPEDHPRAESLKVRERLIDGFTLNIVAKAGLIAHGRGEAFDYLLGECTSEMALTACHAAVAAFLLASHPVISVNGNVAALIPEELVELGRILEAPLEVNLFYRTEEREQAIAQVLSQAGATNILGISKEREKIPELSHLRRVVDPQGIFKADCVLVPLEDGDRTEALIKLEKTVVAIDLNPMSRTAIAADITIIDNVVRAIPEMIHFGKELQNSSKEELRGILDTWDNFANLQGSLDIMKRNLENFVPNLRAKK
ncbi:MAG: 4-phosphopantoate--beta-alanine ligase [Candidatus Hodarchaeota archaeon]